MFGFISVISGLAAIWSLTLLTMERTWVIHSITKNRRTRITMAKMRSAVSIIWAAAIITALAPLFGWNKYVYEVSTTRIKCLLIKRRWGGIFLKIIKRVALQSGRIGMPNPVGMESSFRSGWNGMKSFHSGGNGMAIPFRPEWRVHSIRGRME